MLQKSMDEIAECAAQEVSCLGSSMGSLTNSEDQFSERDITVSGEDEDLKNEFEESTAATVTNSQEELEMETDESNDTASEKSRSRELRDPSSKMSLYPRNEGIRTPPYLSPGITRRVLSNKLLNFQTNL